jgi:hypothetical protein
LTFAGIRLSTYTLAIHDEVVDSVLDERAQAAQQGAGGEGLAEVEELREDQDIERRAQSRAATLQRTRVIWMSLIVRGVARFLAIFTVPDHPRPNSVSRPSLVSTRRAH